MTFLQFEDPQKQWEEICRKQLPVLVHNTMVTAIVFASSTEELVGPSPFVAWF